MTKKNINNFTLVSRNKNKLFNHYGYYSGESNPQNVLVGEACVDINGVARSTFPHGFIKGDWVISPYCDRIRSYCREVDGVTVSDAPIYEELNKRYQGKLNFDVWLMSAEPSELIAWATELTDGRLGFCGKRPEGQEVTAVRVVRFTNVSSGYATYMIVVVGVLEQHLKDVLDYTNPEVVMSYDAQYDVDGYGRLIENPNHRGEYSMDIHGNTITYNYHP